jgi:hypothetical protein
MATNARSGTSGTAGLGLAGEKSSLLRQAQPEVLRSRAQSHDQAPALSLPYWETEHHEFKQFLLVWNHPIVLVLVMLTAPRADFVGAEEHTSTARQMRPT